MMHVIDVNCTHAFAYPSTILCGLILSSRYSYFMRTKTKQYILKESSKPKNGAKSTKEKKTHQKLLLITMV